MQQYIDIQSAQYLRPTIEWSQEWRQRARNLRLRREIEVEERLHSMSLRGLLSAQFHKLFHHRRHIGLGV